MSDEVKKEGQEPPEKTQPTELTDKDLEQAAGGTGGPVVSTAKWYGADKDHKLPLALSLGDHKVALKY